MNIFAKGNALVAKGSSSDAVYVNNCLDEIIKQLSVNRQHIDLFLSLYIKVLDRLFGEDVARSTDVSLNPMWVKGMPGGWLRALMSVSSAGGSPYESNSQVSFCEKQQLSNCIIFASYIIACCFLFCSQRSLGRGSNAGYLDSLPYPISSILQKFAPFSPMFDILSKIQGGYEIKIALLPTKLQV